MAYYTRKKYDDPDPKVSQAGKNVYDAFKDEAIRGALRAISNCVVWGGTGGTHTTAMNAGVGTGSTGGVKIANPLGIRINGRIGTAAAQDNIEFPAGTQASATYVKYLVCAKFGTAGTIVAGNDGTSSTTALLPDLPDGYVAVGYMCYQANGTRGWIRTNSVCTGDTGGTNGTVYEWVNLVNYPYNQA
jgi:hypothetical protein